MKNRVLIVDDEESIRNQLKSRLEREGFTVDAASNGEEALHKCDETEYSVVVVDLKLPVRNGQTVVESLKMKTPAPKTIVITSQGEKALAIQMLKNGLSDYFEKPFDLDQWSRSVVRVAREFETEKESRELIARLEARVERFEGRQGDETWFVSRSPAMAGVNEKLTNLRRDAMRAAEEPCVLIVGEGGSGKEGIARMIHSGSRRGKAPWVEINCAANSEQALEVELFGNAPTSTSSQSVRGPANGSLELVQNTTQVLRPTKRGLFEIAKGGTLFLEEFSEMDPRLQAKVYQALRDRRYTRVGSNQQLEFDVRLIASTHRSLKNLDERTRSGKVHEGLFSLLRRTLIELPALRTRTEDILPMAQQFAERAFQNRGKKFPGFSPEVQTQLKTYSWPGNVRELHNVMERTALVWESGGVVLPQQVAINPARGVSSGGLSNVSQASSNHHGPVNANSTSASLTLVGSGAGGGTSAASPNPSRESLLTPGLTERGTLETYTHLKKRWSEQFEKEYLVAALGRHHGNVSAAAREARLDRSNFLRLLRKYGIKANVFRAGPVSSTGSSTDSAAESQVNAVPSTPGSHDKAA